ncbi:hypothetical protein L198_07776 [Cryptococcus wingfieldii CBS 7118]|uniref:Secreted protein n=1 Tax=Cryptococcus wingfieldii CBS 7118 TaxID=1295528 RepID=A0A1E3HY85_9TREE|nr:hypothetical protein L198_07776 [Cryptococcus wingfieldii CBS 7118]ODN81292.1 hypothetical protein L198_07776 [Cryptococcus wingfieldii CBS 7118]
MSTHWAIVSMHASLLSLTLLQGNHLLPAVPQAIAGRSLHGAELLIPRCLTSAALTLADYWQGNSCTYQGNVFSWSHWMAMLKRQRQGREGSRSVKSPVLQNSTTRSYEGSYF